MDIQGKHREKYINPSRVISLAGKAVKHTLDDLCKGNVLFFPSGIVAKATPRGEGTYGNISPDNAVSLMERYVKANKLLRVNIQTSQGYIFSGYSSNLVAQKAVANASIYQAVDLTSNESAIIGLLRESQTSERGLYFNDKYIAYYTKINDRSGALNSKQATQILDSLISKGLVHKVEIYRSKRSLIGYAAVNKDQKKRGNYFLPK